MVRRIAKWVAIVLAAVLVLAAAFLLWLNTDSGRRFIVGQINAFENWPEGYVCFNRRFMYAGLEWCTQNYSRFIDELRTLCGGGVFQMPADISVLDDPELAATHAELRPIPALLQRAEPHMRRITRDREKAADAEQELRRAAAWAKGGSRHSSLPVKASARMRNDFGWSRKSTSTAGSC